MELKHIELSRLTVSPLNMAGAKKAPDLSNILPSVRARGVLVPLIVRPLADDGERFEIVAGKRRFFAAQVVAEESGTAEPLPCAVMAPGDDAAALEASLIENMARLDPDEVTRWESFTRLVREGRTPEQVAETFGLTELQVKRTLALGNLLPRIRSLYRAEKIDVSTVRHLTLASKAQQREWLALFDDATAYAPAGVRLKEWLFGGSAIPVSAALFDPAGHEIVADLFGEERFFASAADFWTAQNAAIAARAEAYGEAGWREVMVLEPGQPFQSWQHQRCPKRKGGRVYIATDARGHVSFHEGYVTLKEARRIEAGEQAQAEPSASVRPEITSGILNYVDLHRHAAVRASMAECPVEALRVAVAHMMAGSGLWQVRVEPQRAASDAIRESVETSVSEAAFDERRRAVLKMLGFDADTPTVAGGFRGSLAELFLWLEPLDQNELLAVLAIAMGETLEAGAPLIELLGTRLRIDMAQVWQADDALLDQLRDREVLDGIVTELAGEPVAAANRDAAGKVKREIVRDCLAGRNGRTKVDGWVPRWMAFPPSAYTARGGVATVQRHAQLTALFAPEPQPEPEDGEGDGGEADAGEAGEPDADAPAERLTELAA
jgi:ParB family chromosome partitioning protein